MSLSRIASAIPASPTLALNEEAQLLREKGEPVINLGIGEPKNKTPIGAILSSAARLAGGDVKYVPTDGTPSLKKAIVRYMEDNYNRVVALITSSSLMEPNNRCGMCSSPCSTRRTKSSSWLRIGSPTLR